MPIDGSSGPAGLCHRLFREHGPVHAYPLAGAGRFTTLTTEAVALSSGGSIPILASRALGLLLLTSSVFALAALLSRLVGRYRQGLR